jgi:hypothetical protein
VALVERSYVILMNVSIPTIQTRARDRHSLIDRRRMPSHIRAAKWRDLILDGCWEGKYLSRSEAAYAAAMGYANAGASFHEWADVMTTSGVGLDWALRRANGRIRSSRDTDHRLRNTWASASKRVTDRPPIGDKASARWEINQAMSRADFARWGGQRGSTDRLVVSAVHALAMDVGSLVVAASTRRVSEASGVGTARGTSEIRLKRAVGTIWVLLGRKSGACVGGFPTVG